MTTFAIIARSALLAAFVGACALVQSVPGAANGAWAFVFFLFPLPFVGWFVAWQTGRLVVGLVKAGTTAAVLPHHVDGPIQPVRARGNPHVLVAAEDADAAAEDDRRAVAALLAADRRNVRAAARAERTAVAAAPAVFDNGNANGDGDPDAVVHEQFIPGGPAARRQADELARQFALPAARDERRED